MIKTKLDGSSDYAKLLKKYNELVKDVPIEYIILKLKKLGEADEKLKLAEKALKQVQDLINSNEEIVHFHSAKKEFNKPIEDYFRKVK